jgi:hypothetical protein
MENSKQPITPIWMTQNGKESFTPLKPGQKTGYEKLFTGLTKREYFTGVIIQGLLSSFTDREKDFLIKDENWSDTFISNCVGMADEILKQLEK